jgi:hypothetical protein
MSKGYPVYIKCIKIFAILTNAVFIRENSE